VYLDHEHHRCPPRDQKLLLVLLGLFIAGVLLLAAVRWWLNVMGNFGR
jgi:hypothetical protein